MVETTLTFVLLSALGIVITFGVLRCLIYVITEDER
jgi:hypothetical protein